MVVNDDTFMLTDATAYLCGFCSRDESILQQREFSSSCDADSRGAVVRFMLCIGTLSQGGVYEQCG